MKMNFTPLGSHPQWAILLACLAILMTAHSACQTSTAPLQQQEPQSEAPVILYLRAQKQIAPLETSQIRCFTAENNDDMLNYEWSATGGQIQGKGDIVVWTAPDTTGEYTITVVVSNSKGGEATSSVTILVTHEPNRPPIIHSMTCQDCTNGIKASKWKSYSILCDASDPEGDNLTYQWSVTIGKIIGDGRLVTWQTFDESGYAVIRVKVKDDKGNEAEGNLAINISCCD
jgi:hypothetical protein